MSVVGGQGGHAKLGAAGPTIPIGDWQVVRTATLADATRSDSLGYKRRKKTLVDVSWTFNRPWDDSQILDATAPGLDLQEGDEIAELIFIYGESGLTIKGAAIIEAITDVCNAATGDLVRQTVSGFFNGVVTRAVQPA